MSEINITVVEGRVGQDPYIMPYESNPENRGFKRFIDSFMWRKYSTIEQAWKEYRG